MSRGLRQFQSVTPDRRIGIACDVGTTVGVGHVMRTAALAEEMQRRGWWVEYACNAHLVPLAASRLAGLGVGVIQLAPTANAYLEWIRRAKLDGLVTDSYLLPAAVSEAVATAIPVLAFVDGAIRNQTASLYVDQNYGAEHTAWPIGSAPIFSNRLAGTEFAQISDAVRNLRRNPNTADSRPMNVLLSLGGTDAGGYTTLVTEAIRDYSEPLNLTVVTKTALHPMFDACRSSSIKVEVTAPSGNFPQLLARCDAAVSATGTTTWELCCLGKPMAALAVAENQLPAYRALVGDGVVFGAADLVGVPPNQKSLSGALAEFFTNVRFRRMAADRAYKLVDGRGKERVVDGFSALL